MLLSVLKQKSGQPAALPLYLLYLLLPLKGERSEGCSCRLG